MRKPNYVLLSTDPLYMKNLINGLEQFGWPRRRVCTELGIGYRSMTDYVTGVTQWSYAVQYAVESLHDWAREIYLSGKETNTRELFDRKAETA